MVKEYKSIHFSLDEWLLLPMLDFLNLFGQIIVTTYQMLINLKNTSLNQFARLINQKFDTLELSF